jgi:hypothetical protein
MWRIAAACVALAGLSLVLPSEPSYDPWAWLVWGREVAHFSLDTTSGPSWKPLPVVFTTLFAPFSALDDRIPPALWVVVARTGGLLAAVMAFRVAARLVGGAAVRQWAAGIVAAGSLLLTPEWLRYLIHGNEVPLAIALALVAVDRHLDGSRRTAFVLGAVVCLARPELFGFLMLYGAYLWWTEPATGRLVVGAAVLVVAAWLVPSWVGSGDPFYAGNQARSEPSWSLSLAPVPWRAALSMAQDQALLVIELLAFGAVAAALVRRRAGSLAPERPGAVVALGAFGVTMVALYAAMTEAGFSGNARYVLPAIAAITILGGVGAALAGELAVRAAAGRRPALAAALAGTLLLVAAAPEIRNHVRATRTETNDSLDRSRLQSSMHEAVRRVGVSYVLLFGPPSVNRAFQTHLAWDLKLHLGDVQGSRGRGIVFRVRDEPVAGVLRVYRKARKRVVIARVGPWRVSERSSAQHVFTWPILGFSLRGAAAREGFGRPAARASL